MRPPSVTRNQDYSFKKSNPIINGIVIKPLWKWHVPITLNMAFQIYPFRCMASVMEKSSSQLALHHWPHYVYIRGRLVLNIMCSLILNLAFTFEFILPIMIRRHKCFCLFCRFRFHKKMGDPSLLNQPLATSAMIIPLSTNSPTKSHLTGTTSRPGSKEIYGRGTALTWS